MTGTFQLGACVTLEFGEGASPALECAKLLLKHLNWKGINGNMPIIHWIHLYYKANITISDHTPGGVQMGGARVCKLGKLDGIK